MKRIFSKLSVLCVLMTALTFLISGTASAQTIGKGSSHALPTAGNAAFLTVEQGAALGIKPGMPDQNGKIPTIMAQSLGVVVPNSSQGCNGNVCIFVTGSGLHVSDWSTTGFDATRTCTFATFFVNGRIRATSRTVCGGPNTRYTSDLNNPGNFANHTQLCNTWVHISGKPCETVHS